MIEADLIKSSKITSHTLYDITPIGRETLKLLSESHSRKYKG